MKTEVEAGALGIAHAALEETNAHPGAMRSEMCYGKVSEFS
jgi:hypothetical protein